MHKSFWALALVAAFAMPAEAHIVYLKDGTQVVGTVTVEETSLVVTPDGGERRTLPYEAVQGVSLDGVPLYPAPERLGGDWAMWGAVAANVLAIGAALYVATWASGRPAEARP